MSTNNTTNEEQYTCDFCGGEGADLDLIPPYFEQEAAWCDKCEEELFARYRDNDELLKGFVEFLNGDSLDAKNLKERLNELFLDTEDLEEFVDEDLLQEEEAAENTVPQL